MKDYSNPSKWKFSYFATLKDADAGLLNPKEGYVYMVIAKDMASAAKKAEVFASEKRGGTWYVDSIRTSEATEHVIL